ncbi:hypothetical protein [Bacillus taeanensis]|uniref:Uncharacterized protein n=1 Tax=Bacillus taeanensis TaxID=273032 RepID=A0A366XYC3_9BACI|nr:hypothetical protein [Bacillus taeanensis]RBW68921.1 hypothetical protein DS031_14395 [Bacillus taeanensis]
MEQINLPAHGEENGAMHSRMIAVSDQQDGRTNVRAWIRTNERGKAIFAAAYSTHTSHRETYMNIALPLPFGNTTGVLTLNHDKGNGLTLSSLPCGGDEGIYFHTKRFTVRLPLQEHFHVWKNDDAGLHAVHTMWLFRKKFLSITYHIHRRQ